MKKFCTPLIFTIFFLVFISASNAMDRGSSSRSSGNPISQSYIFGVSLGNHTIFSCQINPQNGVPIEPCNVMQSAEIGVTIPSEITIAPYGKHAYITGFQDRSNNLYICQIIDATGRLDYCEPNQIHTTEGIIRRPQVMAINSNGRFMYITSNTGANGIITYCELDHETAKPHNCKIVKRVSYRLQKIAISPNNKYIYITHATAVTICKIKLDHTFSDCKDNTSETYETVLSVVPDPFGKHVYVTDGNRHYPSICTLDPGDLTSFSGCVAGNTLRDDPADSGISGAAIHSHGQYVYFSSDSNTLYTCAINYHDGTFTQCDPFQSEAFDGIVSIAFR